MEVDGRRGARDVEDALLRLTGVGDWMGMGTEGVGEAFEEDMMNTRPRGAEGGVEFPRSTFQGVVRLRPYLINDTVYSDHTCVGMQVPSS